MTIDKVIKILKSECCSECSYTTESAPSCACPECEVKDAVNEAIRYLEEYKRDKPIWEEILKSNPVANALSRKYHGYVGY